MTTITINSNLPGVNPASAGIPGLIGNFYSFALTIAGILAFGAIVYGGIKYAAGAGNPSSQSEGKSWVTNALLGLLLLAGAWIILYTINPTILTLPIPGLPGLAAVPAGAPTTPGGNVGIPPVPGVCPLAPLSPITDPQALAMENDQTVVWNSSDPNAQKNLDAVAAAYSKMQVVLAKIGDSATVNSVYRPLAYQAHFYEIYQSAQAYGIQEMRQPSYSTYPECTTIVANLQAEEKKHGICYGSSPCNVAKPDGCAPHVKGVAIDITLSGPIGLSAINPILAANNVGLYWRALPSDKPHFELVNPPFTGCASN